MPGRLPRLTRRGEFLRAAVKGRKAARPGLVLQALPSGAGDDRPLRVGFTATKKIGGAVVRNRAKRRLRAAAQAILPQLGKPGFDYVLIARNGAPTRAWPRLLDDVKTALISLAAESDSPSRASQRAPSSSA